MDDQKQVERRLGWLACGILLWGAIITVRLVMLQVVHHRDYLRAARKAQEIQVKVPAIRGSIFDCNNRLLAMSTRLLGPRRQKRLLELFGKLEWDQSYDTRAERERR